MKSPFPGMDPYLETVWPDVHTSLLTYVRDAMNPTLPGDLRARLQERVYIEAPFDEGRQFGPDIHIVERPHQSRGGQSAGAAAVLDAPADVAVPAYSFDLLETTERYIDILDVRNGGRVVTTIELLSPANKIPGLGRQKYIAKQAISCDAGVNLVELDLVRAGRPTTVVITDHASPPLELRTIYHAGIVDFTRGGRVGYYPIGLRQPLPRLPIPLRVEDQPIPLDLQAALDLTYERGYYGHDLLYGRPLDPPLDEKDRLWAEQRIAAWRKERATA